MTYDGTDQSAVIIRGAGKIIGCLIAQSCRRGREEEEEEEGGGETRPLVVRTIDDRPRKIGEEREGERPVPPTFNLRISGSIYRGRKERKELVIQSMLFINYSFV